MKKQPATKIAKKKEETRASLKNETHKINAVKKGYNEHNPTQPQGAFIPDAINKKD
ncbi:MAG: hypothetical protein ABI402_09210 [Ferruginibacter sp.]